MNEYDAYQLDAAMALRFDLIDKDFERMQTHIIIDGLFMLAKCLGAKDIVTPQFEPRIREFEEKDELPKLDDVIKELGGNGTVLQL